MTFGRSTRPATAVRPVHHPAEAVGPCPAPSTTCPNLGEATKVRLTELTLPDRGCIALSGSTGALFQRQAVENLVVRVS